jgi:hypothetical protein
MKSLPKQGVFWDKNLLKTTFEKSEFGHNARSATSRFSFAALIELQNLHMISYTSFIKYVAYFSGRITCEKGNITWIRLTNVIIKYRNDGDVRNEHAQTIEECQEKCLQHTKPDCKSVEFRKTTRERMRCVLSGSGLRDVAPEEIIQRVGTYSEWRCIGE